MIITVQFHYMYVQFRFMLLKYFLIETYSLAYYYTFSLCIITLRVYTMIFYFILPYHSNKKKLNKNLVFQKNHRSIIYGPQKKLEIIMNTLY